MKEEIEAILAETPHYDPELNLSAEAVGKVLNQLIQNLEQLLE
jgi:hypothetical protein